MKKRTETKKRQQEKKVEIMGKSFSWKGFSIKIVILFFAVLLVIIFTDKKEYFVGDQSNNHVQRKWRSFYRFTEKGHKDVDILVMGNSHASAGVEPFIVSQATATNCFILNTPGAAINDMYFNLKEVLRYTKPKLVIIETSCFYGNEIGEEWGRIQSFEAKKGTLTKLYIMPFLFESDDWVKAWSPTIRNHSFLLTDTARIHYNVKNVGKEKNPDRMKLDLGRFSHGNNFLQDTTLAKYDSIGPPMICENIVIQEANKKYLKKIVEVCRANDMKLILLTVPMYYKVFTNYDILKNIQNEEYKKYPDVKWLDLQKPYDTTVYTVEAFNNEYSGAIHTTNYGMNITAYKLADFLLENYPNTLPDRSKTFKWINDFSNTNYFIFNQDVVQGMPGCSSIMKNKQIGNYKVKELALQENGKDNNLILKIEKQENMPNLLTVQCNVIMHGKEYLIPIQMFSPKDIFPPQHKVYIANIQRELKIKEVVSIHN